VTDLTSGEAVTVRELFAASPFLGDPMVWSVVVARCDDPSVTARWSDFEVRTEAGDRLGPTAIAVNYQSHADGGCANTTSVPDDQGGVVQVTNAERHTPQGATV
jgi:hypothetical protein